VRSRILRFVVTGTMALSLVPMLSLFGPFRSESHAQSEGGTGYGSSSGYGSDTSSGSDLATIAAADAADASRYARHQLNECGRYNRGKPLIDCVANVLETYSARLRQAAIQTKAPRAAQTVLETVQKLRQINTSVSSVSTTSAPAATAPTVTVTAPTTTVTAPTNTRPTAIAPARTITVTAPPTATIPREKIAVVTQSAPNKSGAIAVLARAASIAAGLVASTVMGEGRTVYDLVRGVLSHAKSLVEVKG
jgi:hypothetical protein